MNRQKVIDDSILVTRDAIHILRIWLELLERWQNQGQAEPDEFTEACHQLQEADLWSWARQAGGHGLEALARAVHIQPELLEQVYHRSDQRWF